MHGYSVNVLYRRIVGKCGAEQIGGHKQKYVGVQIDNCKYFQAPVGILSNILTIPSKMPTFNAIPLPVFIVSFFEIL